MLRSWRTSVVFGGLIAAAFSGLCVAGLVERSLRGPPTTMTVAEVRAYFAAGGARLANVRIAALVDCADLRTANGHSYAVGATQGSDDWPLVLVALNGAARCEVVARDPFGDVERGDPALWREAGVPRETPVLRPAHLHLAGFVVFCVGAGFGFLLIVDGLRTRRAEAEQLRRLLAEPVLPSASAQSGPGGAYRGVDLEASLLPRPLQISRRWLALRRLGAVVAVATGIVGIGALAFAADTLPREQLAIAVALLVIVTLGFRQAVRDARARYLHVREVLHARPEEVLLTVLESRIVHSEIERRVFTLKTPEGCVFEEVFDHGALPFYLEPFGAHVLALRAASDPSRVVVLRDDLSPLEADADEPARVRGRHRQRSPTRTEAPRRSRRWAGAARLRR